MSRQLDLEPGVVGPRLQLPGGEVRLLVIDMVSLVPGTLSCGLDGDVLRVHALNVGSDVHDQLGELAPVRARCLPHVQRGSTSCRC